ncbi:MAG: hypothetical protein ACRDIE_25195 [Chloroflexota bacterium]
MSRPTAPWCNAAFRATDLLGCVATGKVPGILQTQTSRGRIAPA